MLPTVSNPLVLNFSGHIPALKNEKVPVTRKNGKPALVSNQTVQTFYKRVQGNCIDQMRRQGFDVIEWPQHVAVYAEFWFYVANKTNIAASDGDNAYTTLQELLQKSAKNKPYIHAIDDDKQVSAFHVETYAVHDKIKEGARLYVWTMEEEDYHDRLHMWEAFFRYLRKRAFDTPTEQEEVDFDEITNLLT